MPPEYRAPGVFVEETPFRSKPIEGVDVSVAGLVGTTFRKPRGRRVVEVASLAEFVRDFGDGTGVAPTDSRGRQRLAATLAARAFFANGGRRLHVAAVAAGAAGVVAGLAALAEVAAIGVVFAPGAGWLASRGQARVATAHAAHCATLRHRIALVDPPAGANVEAVRAFRAKLASDRLALHHPWVEVRRGRGRALAPPSGFVAGILARVDAARGPWKAPGGEALVDAIRPAAALSDALAGELAAASINPIRALPGRGIVLWGARTLAGDGDWKYVNVRRLFVYLARSIEEGLQWTVFEPNDEKLWARVRAATEEFLTGPWRAGAFAGAKPEQAFFVRCDRTTMTQADIDSGRLVATIGVAPLRPAEFVCLRIGLWTATR